MESKIDVQEIIAEIQGKNTQNNQPKPITNKYIPTMHEMMAATWENRNKTSLEYLSGHWNVPIYREIRNNGVVRFIKRVIRKLIKFYMVPIIEDQNANNANILQVLNAQNYIIMELKNEIEKLRSKEKMLL